MNKSYIITYNKGCQSFCTTAKNARGALRRLVKNSRDFEFVTDDKSITIKIRVVK